MTRNVDNTAPTALAITTTAPTGGLMDRVGRGKLRAVRVLRGQMPRLLLAAVAGDVAEAVRSTSNADAALSLLMRRLENEYRKHWLMNTPAN